MAAPLNAIQAPAAPKTGDTFEDVLYGSESEIEDSDEDDGKLSTRHPVSKTGSRRQEKGVRLRLDDNEPMDLLHGVSEKLTSKPDSL